ncbi:MAG: cyclic nucleotide-binding domain-containing protein [Deltaproteobacteria bacterium]|nr:cyclic nucleotide-binding domain-containing protein [Deltaproteobacteria bacterium]
MCSDIYKYLSKMPHFSLLQEEEIRRVAEVATVEHYSKGAVFAEQDKTIVDSIYVVTAGVLELLDDKKGTRMHSGLITAGEVFGGISIMMNGGISLRTVIVDEDCSGYEIPRETFQDLCRQNKAFYEYFLENFSKNIIDASITSLIETGQLSVFLAGVDPFSFLPEEELVKITAKLSVVQYPKNTVLFVQRRTRIGHLYILHKGSADRYYEEAGKKTMHSVLGEGDSYGGISILVNDGVSVRTLQVKETSYFYLLPKDVFLDICRRFPVFSEFFTDIFGKRMLEKSYATIIAKTARSGEEGLQFFNQPISNLCTRKPIFGLVDLSIRDAANLMVEYKISSLFIKDNDGKCVGVLTEKDLTRKVVVYAWDVDHPVSEVMTTAVQTVSSQTLIFKALMVMMKEDIRHLAVMGSDDEIVGIISNRDILTAQGQSPVFLLRELADADSLEEIIDRHNKLPRQIRSLITSGVQARNLTRFITTVSDTILKKLIEFTLAELGPPPVKFVFMILGSEGRNEQTLKTDQDNAIIFEDVPKSEKEKVMAYFLNFGEKICGLLDKAGYAFCTGGVMAKNPKWCQPLSRWKAYFSEWIHAAEGKDLLQASIFFDFRGGYGDMALIDRLRQHLFAALGGWPGFFRHLTENAMYFRPPIGFFRNFVVESKGEHKDTFDIKSAMTPIVDFARIYALKNKIEETNTLERLKQLRSKQVLQQQQYEELEKAYGFLLQTRFVRQVTVIMDENGQPDNYINPKKLTRIEQKMLKEIFTRVEKFQSRLEADFIGLV